MKKIIVLLLTIILTLCSVLCVPVSATELKAKSEITIERLENGDYIETIIIYDNTNSKAATKSGSKTKNYKNSAGAIMWSVTVNGTFTYNGTTSSCTKASHSTTAPGSAWTIKSASSTKSGYSAIANATATYTTQTTSQDYSMSVTLYCSPYGILS